MSSKFLLLLFACVFPVLLSGCSSSSELNTKYGRSRGEGASSVNGLLILSQMFEEAGYDVSAWRRLSPKLDNEQVIVWAPDRFAVPTEKETQFLEKWLAGSSGRTLVYIGRDYDCATDYWKRLMDVDPDNRLQIRREAARAKAEHEQYRLSSTDSEDCAWFSLDAKAKPKIVTSVRGPWGEAAKESSERPLRLWSHTTIELPESATGDEAQEWRGSLQVEPLLETENTILAARLYRPAWQGSQIIVIANGSWLLNLPLTESVNRRLAGQLIVACGPPGPACFLESGPAELLVTDRDTSLPLVLQAFTVWPFNLVALHLLMLGIVFCFSIYPIMGTPKSWGEEHVSDFGKHVHALGELLERERDAEFAEAQVRQFREVVGTPVLGETGDPRRGRVV